jgi:replicative DNA helicase
MGFTVREKKQEKHVENTVSDDKEVKRIIPIDSNNEQFILGHAINDGRVLEVLLNEVDGNTFLYTNHRALFECCQYLYHSKVKVTPDSIDVVKKRFRGGDTLRLDYVTELVAVFGDSVAEENYRFHVSKLKDDKIKETLSMNLLPELTRSMLNSSTTTENIIEKINKMMSMLEDGRTDGDFKFIPMVDVDEIHTKENASRETGSSFGTTGYGKLDRFLTDGLGATKMTIVAGRPAMGKSALVANMLLRLGLLGIPVAVFNFEMDCISMYDRFVAIRANIPITKLIRNRDKMTPMERMQEQKAKDEISKLPIYFYTASTQSMEGIKRDIRILKERYGVKIVAYDLFDKIRFKYSGNRSTADILNESLKIIQGFGRDFDIHQILVVQIGRSAEKRKNKRPKLSELKDAGGYEERADNVFFLYRPSYYDSPEEEGDGECGIEKSEDVEIIIAKQRQGTSNVKVTLDFWPATTTIAEPILTSSDGAI